MVTLGFPPNNLSTENQTLKSPVRGRLAILWFSRVGGVGSFGDLDRHRPLVYDLG